MARTKHTEITKQLRENILSQRYQDYLPPVRTLVKEFDTSVRTMTKAIKPLTESGLILPTNQGTKIFVDRPIRPKTGMVAILYHSDMGKLTEHDPLVENLKKLAAENGYQAIMMEIPDGKILSDAKFLESIRVDGYIFIYSSFYKLMTGHLLQHNIPFVVANWMPINYGVHWVDFNTEQMMYSLVEQIIRHTRNHRIAFTFPTSASIFQRWLKERWNAVARHFNLPDYADNELCFAHDLEDVAKEWVKLPQPPEIIISNHRNTQTLKDVFNSRQLPLQLVIPSNISPEVTAWRYPAADYRVLAQETWNIFGQVLDGTAGNPQSYLVDFNPKIKFT